MATAVNQPTDTSVSTLTDDFLRKVTSCERMQGEADEPHSAFLMYRDMPKRSGEALAEQIGRSYSTITYWARRWKWMARCKAYDAEIAALAAHLGVRATFRCRVRQAHIAAAVQDKAHACIEALKPGKVNTQESVTLLRAGAELERQALEITEPVAVKSSENPVQVAVSVSTGNVAVPWLRQSSPDLHQTLHQPALPPGTVGVPIMEKVLESGGGPQATHTSDSVPDSRVLCRQAGHDPRTHRLDAQKPAEQCTRGNGRRGQHRLRERAKALPAGLAEKLGTPGPMARASAEHRERMRRRFAKPVPEVKE